MAVVSFTIPNPQVTRFNEGFAKFYGYRETLEDGTPNPETKTQFAKRMMIEHAKRVVKEAEGVTVATAAKAANDADIDTNLTIT